MFHVPTDAAPQFKPPYLWLNYLPPVLACYISFASVGQHSLLYYNSDRLFAAFTICSFLKYTLCVHVTVLICFEKKLSLPHIPCKKEPRNPRNSAEKFLAFHAFLHIRKSQESQESLGFPGKRGDSWLSTLSRKSWKAWKGKRLCTFRAFQDSTVSWEARNVNYSQKPGKAWKARKKCSTLSWLSLICKKARKARNDSQLSRIPRFLGKHGIPT